MRHVLLEKGRLEAFSDGVMAVIITIMVLELKVPHGTDLASLAPLAPTFAAYVLSFVNIGIYWNNHHHMFQAIEGYDGRSMWANLHLLFWLSLIPFMTAWLGQNPQSSIATAVYGAVLFFAGLAYSILVQCLISANGSESTLARAMRASYKGIASVVMYAIAIPVAFYVPWISDALYIAVALMWFVPDRRVERELVAR